MSPWHQLHFSESTGNSDFGSLVVVVLLRFCRERPLFFEHGPWGTSALFRCFTVDSITQLLLKWTWWIRNSFIYLSTTHELGGGFKYFFFSSLFGEMIQFDYYFSDGLKPPTSESYSRVVSVLVYHQLAI